MPNRLIPAQIRGARGFLDWSILELANAAGVSVSTVKRMESAEPQPHPTSDGVRGAVRVALETAGVRFLDDEGEGWGLRLQRRSPR